MALEKVERKNYVSILGSDASLRIVVKEGTEGSEVREYETSDGKKGKKTEMVFQKLTGKITNVAFQDGDFGKMLQLTVSDDAGDLVLSVSTEQNFGEDIMKKLPNIDLSKEVTISPFTFEDDKGKTKKGVTITQNDVKIKNFFYDEAAKQNSNGYPNVEVGKTYDKDDWKIYFMQARKFLVGYITEKFVNTSTPASNEINPDDVPIAE